MSRTRKKGELTPQRIPHGVTFARDDLTGSTFIVSGKGSTDGDRLIAVALFDARHRGIAITEELKAMLERKAVELDRREMLARFNRAVAPSFRALLSAASKRDARVIADKMQITHRDFADLMANSGMLGLKWHDTHYDYVPEQEDLTDEDRAVTLGSSAEEIARVERRRQSMFGARSHRSVHLLESDSGPWHVFYLSFRDTGGDPRTRKHHWVAGPHVHFTSHLFAASKEDVLHQLSLKHASVDSFHIRFEHPDEEGAKTVAPRTFVVRPVR